LSKSVVIAVAGSGSTTATEVEDLLNDELVNYDEVVLIVPVDKDGFTKSVQLVEEWADQEEVIGLLPEGMTKSRKARHIDSTTGDVVEYLANDVDPEEHERFLYVAVPDEDDSTYDDLVTTIEQAIEFGILVKNLCAGLDDVTLTEPDAEPEPEPEKPARRPRSKKTEPKTESVEQDVAAAKAQSDASAQTDLIGILRGAVADITKGIDGLQQAAEILEAAVVEDEAAESAEAPTEAPEATPKRGRGRPRTTIPRRKEIFDEDADEWVVRPRGRQPKGTQIREINTETGEVIEGSEGVV
jgi:hypothetical protein